MCIGMANGGKIMTPQEAIITLKQEYLGDSEFMEFAKQMGANALEKQIPKKPNEYREFEDGAFYNIDLMCSTCNNAVIGQPYKPSYCKHCGQKLIGVILNDRQI